MPSSLNRVLLLVIFLGSAAAAWIFLKNDPPARVNPPPLSVEVTPVPTELSVLGEAPDWSKLERFQDTITRVDFENLLTTVFTTGEGWKSYIEINDAGARIVTGADPSSDVFLLRFSPPGTHKPAPRHWKTAAELPPAPQDRPLLGLRIAIDPGHIGGQWAQVEQRWFKTGDSAAICEGDMTLQVSRLLKPRLEALGATVLLVRQRNEPVTALRPDSLLDAAIQSNEPVNSPEDLRNLADRLFYRTAEIRARAKLVNDSLKPDLVLCLHFNADPWGSPDQPTLVNRTHLHLLLNGAYTDEEVSLADQRFSMLEKLLGRTHEEEVLVGTTVADTFAAISGLPPFAYPEGSLNARSVRGNPYLWARNLLANRLYDCPVIFMEPYVMNSTIDSPRITAGDYDGIREINGRYLPSIFREYADALSQGLARHYARTRRNSP
jgi:N-acetylmuramoyl-L-alanine amidase